MHNSASGTAATIGGGAYNTASGDFSTVPGGDNNTATGKYSFAAGCYANANYQGAFVWLGESADGHCYVPALSGGGQFVAVAPGGVWFYSSGNGTGVTLPANSGSWSTMSDRNMKANFMPVSGENLLARLNVMPMSTWNYKAQDPHFRHLGPMAQDFYAAFGLGEDDKHIDEIDSQGVALAGVQALYRLGLKKDKEIAELKQANAARDAQVGALQTQAEALRAQNDRLTAEVEQLRQAQQQMAVVVAQLAKRQATRTQLARAVAPGL